MKRTRKKKKKTCNNRAVVDVVIIQLIQRNSNEIPVFCNSKYAIYIYIYIYKYKVERDPPQVGCLQGSSASDSSEF